MNFPIFYFVPGIEMAVCLRGAFSAEECDNIVDMADLIAHQQGGYHKGKVGTRSPEGEVVPEARITDIIWLEPNYENDWVHRRISQMMGKVNSEKFQLDLSVFDGFQFSQYKPGAHYDWHTDVVNEPANPALHRKVSISVMLTDPTEYEGGDLLLNTSGNQERPESMKPQKGDIVFFYSFVPHRVSPVTKGVRKTLVTWAMGEKFR